ncbi:MAG TPA: zeta toxin family protein [Puia sp.]|jgi:predicted ABC-type ATPase|nr:zeta toxin family protein [Puia sp.]
MNHPEFIFITGCNAAGKSSLIRTHLSEYPDYQVIMTDVYKSRSRGVFLDTVKDRKDIMLETPFNNETFKDFANIAKSAGYETSLIVLFLNNPAESFERVAARSALENGLYIPEDEVKYNFTENLKNVSKYYFYFDKAFFIYTGVKNLNQHIMTFAKGKLMEYKSNDLDFIQRFAGYAFSIDRMSKDDLDITAANAPFLSDKLEPRHQHRM